MIIIRLKAKNQVTIPSKIVKRLHLKQDEFLMVDIKGDVIQLTPVEIKPKYSKSELKAIDKIVEREKKQAKKLKAGKEFSNYINKLS
jgi:bifunctional DNA-binding transcriptional regulator/antitoxin component of YhaV-PrlF toxin-antitoxin module